MNVLILSWEYPPCLIGGLGMACEGLTRALAKFSGLKLSVALPDSSGLEDVGAGRVISLRSLVQSENLVLLEKAFSPGHGYSAGLRPNPMQISDDYLSCADKIVEFCDEKIDVVHAHDWMTFRGAERISKISDARFVAHVHSTVLQREGRDYNSEIFDIELSGLRSADKIVSVSDQGTNHLVDCYGVPFEKICRIYNAADHTPVRGMWLGDHLGRPIVTFIGRITYQKGPECFVRSAALVARYCPEAIFVMAGVGDMLEETKGLVHSLGLKDKFEFPGFLSRDQVTNLLAVSTVYVMPSVAEPFGIGALEAIRMGIPVVVPRDSGVAECVSDIWSVDTCSVRDVAAAIEAIVSDRRNAMTYAKKAQKDALLLTWDSAAATVVSVYNSLAGC